MPFRGRVRTFYRHESSARKGEAWARNTVDAILQRAAEGREELPNLGQGYTDIHRAAHVVERIARNKLRQALSGPWEQVFWTSVLDEANAIKAEQNPGIRRR